MFRRPNTPEPGIGEELPRKQPGWGAPHPKCARFFESDILKLEKISSEDQEMVFKARLPLYGICAVKYLKVLSGGTFVQDCVRQAQRELVASRSLSHHPNIVNFYGTVRDNQKNDIGFVSEFMGGGSLLDVINKSLESKTIMNDDEWYKMGTRWAIQIARALAYCHQESALHRDVKPENTLLSKDLLTIKLCDFGVARPNTDGFNSCNRGTPYYMAPEVIGSFKTKYDSSADVFSYAMFLYAMFHKKHPELGFIANEYEYLKALKEEQRPDFYDNIPGEIRRVITECWKTNSKERKTMQEVTEILEQYWSIRYPEEEEF